MSYSTVYGLSHVEFARTNDSMRHNPLLPWWGVEAMTSLESIYEGFQRILGACECSRQLMIAVMSVDTEICTMLLAPSRSWGQKKTTTMQENE